MEMDRPWNGTLTAKCYPGVTLFAVYPSVRSNPHRGAGICLSYDEACTG